MIAETGRIVPFEFQHQLTGAAVYRTIEARRRIVAHGKPEQPLRIVGVG